MTKDEKIRQSLAAADKLADTLEGVLPNMQHSMESVKECVPCRIAESRSNYRIARERLDR